MYKFYIRMDGDIFGPYSAKGMMELDMLPDIMVTEASIDTWQPAGNFDFANLAKQEVLKRLKSTPKNDVPDEMSTLEQKRKELKARLNNNGNLTSQIENETFVKLPQCNFPERIEFMANFNEGLNSIGGKIIITPTQLIFHPHCVNFGDLNDCVFEICQISGYEKGILSFMYISFLDGSRIKLTVWKKSEIIAQLEARRTSLIK